MNSAEQSPSPSEINTQAKTDPAPAPAPSSDDVAAKAINDASAYFAQRAALGPKSPEAIVRGGTTSSRADTEMAQKMSETRERWKDYDDDNAAAALPVEQGGGRLYQRNFAANTSPRVLLQYVGRTRDVLFEMLCELVVDEVTSRHTLTLVCPECVKRGRPQTFSQIHLVDNNRAWHLDTRGSGEIKTVKNSVTKTGIEFYTSAGKIMDTEVFGCPNEGCGCKFQISENVMRRVR